LKAQLQVGTPIGAGGCSESRLGVQVCADELESFPDGVRFVDLVPVDESGFVVDAVASAVGARLEQGLSVANALVRAREGTKTLIILDNCEHLVNECADAVSTLLRGGDGLRVLATSREPLGL